MSASFEKYQKRKLLSSYFSVVISISLVLFMVGILGLIVININKVSDVLKEKVTITLFLKNSIKKDSISKLQQKLKRAPYIKSVHFITKKQAAKDLVASTGEDFVEFLGYNPLRNAFNIRLKANYVTTGKVDSLATNFKKMAFINDVNYDKPLIRLLTNNINKFSFWILILSTAFTIISVLIINSSIRLSIYAKRFIIKTMQMVGATKGFIRRPFIWQNIKLGILGAIIADSALAISVFYINKNIPFLQLLQNKIALGILFLGIFVLGVIITWLSTFFAAQRFLNLRTNDLY